MVFTNNTKASRPDLRQTSQLGLLRVLLNLVMPDPFKLFGRLFVSSFVITGYFFVFLAQTIWFIAFRQTDKIGDAFGYLGRKIADELAGMFSSK